MFRRMRQALDDIGDNSDEDDPKIETNSDGDGRESNVAEENEGEEETGEDGDEEERGEVEDDEERGEVEDEEQLEGSRDEEEAGAAEDKDQLGGAQDEEETGGTKDEEEIGKGEGEETIIVEIVNNPTTDPPPGISRTMSDPVTQTEQSQVEDKKHPPIKILNPVTQEWSPKHAVIDTGCDDDWISHSLALQLDLTITVFDNPPKMTTFSGEPMSPVGQVMVTWEATSTGRTAETLANVAENPPFDFLLGSNFYWGKDGESYFDEPVEILRMSKKPTDDESSDMKATHDRRIQAGVAAATARQQATKEENSRLRNSAPQQDIEEEEDDGGEYD